MRRRFFFCAGYWEDQEIEADGKRVTVNGIMFDRIDMPKGNIHYFEATNTDEIQKELDVFSAIIDKIDPTGQRR